MSTTHPILKQAIESINFFSKIKYVFFLKDKDGKYLAMTDYAAAVNGIDNPDIAIGKTTMELMGEEYPKISQQITELDNYLIDSDRETISSINFFNYRDNIQARLVLRNKLFDPITNDVLGILFQEIPSGINNECISIMDSLGKMEPMEKFPDVIANPLINKLTHYEREICFLIAIGWVPTQIKDFFNRLYPDKPKSLDAIIKKKNAICHKLEIEFNHTSHLREFLVQNEVYKQIPQNLLDHLQGAYLVN